MAEEIDFSLYVRSPIINVASGIALARALLSATPSDAPPNVKKAARKLRQSAQALQDTWVARSSREKALDPRPADQAMDNAIAALHGRLASYAALAVNDSRNGVRAQELLDRLFPNGLAFLRLPYAEEWAEISTLLKHIDDSGLAKDLDRLCGGEFLETVRAQFAEYGQALGVTRANGEKDVLVAEPLRVLSKAVVAYAMQVIAALEEADGKTWTSLRAALAPLDNHRMSSSRRRGPGSGPTEGDSEGGEDSAPEEPLPLPLPPPPEGPTA